MMRNGEKRVAESKWRQIMRDEGKMNSRHQQ